MVKGSPVPVPESCFLRVRANRSWWDKHTEGFTGDTKRFLGRIWARVARDDHKPDSQNVVVGVRG